MMRVLVYRTPTIAGTDNTKAKLTGWTGWVSYKRKEGCGKIAQCCVFVTVFFDGMRISMIKLLADVSRGKKRKSIDVLLQNKNHLRIRSHVVRRNQSNRIKSHLYIYKYRKLAA
mmetsp:Transcript_9054/g.13113  ORF Transcript_9054/g.13113 Transcript_9054/m.13113 type:complete len:114 (-) Transcript_9054:690-1031(-)